MAFNFLKTLANRRRSKLPDTPKASGATAAQGYWMESGWGYGSMNWTQDKYENAVGDLSRYPLIATALHWIREQWMQAVPKVRRRGAAGREWQDLDSHPILDLLFDPNRRLNYNQTLTGHVYSRNTNGNTFYYLAPSRVGPTQFRYLWHDAMSQTADGMYHYSTANGVYDFEPDEILHIKTGLDYENWGWGYAELKRQCIEVFGDKAWSVYANNVGKNLGMHSFALIPKVPITNDQVQIARDQIGEKATGENAGKPFIPPFPAEPPVPIGFSPDKLAVDVFVRRNVQRIFACFPLDPMIFGLVTESKTFANQGEAREAAWTDCVIPTAVSLEDDINLRITPAFGDPDRLEFYFDFSNVPALAGMRAKRHQSIREDWKAKLIDRATALQEMNRKSKPEDENVYFSGGGGGGGMGGEDPNQAQDQTKDQKNGANPNASQA